MSIRAGLLAHKVMLALVVGVILCVLYGMAGCAGLGQAARSVAAPALGAATGGLLGSLAGPAGTIAGATIGAALGDAVEENASLRAGWTQGSGSVDQEVARWKGGYYQEQGARIAAKAGEGFFRKWAWRAAWIALAYFAFLRRQWIWKTITGQGVRSRFWTFIHTLGAGDITRKLAIGDNPIEAPPVPPRVEVPVRVRAHTARRIKAIRRKRKAVRR